MDQLVDLNNRGFNVDNLDTWKWDSSSNYLWLYFTGSENPVLVDGEDATIFRSFLVSSSQDLVKWHNYNMRPTKGD